MNIERELIRIDYHDWNDEHGGTEGIRGNELAAWVSGDFHYHVKNWNP